MHGDCFLLLVESVKNVPQVAYLYLPPEKGVPPTAAGVPVLKCSRATEGIHVMSLLSAVTMSTHCKTNLIQIRQ